MLGLLLYVLYTKDIDILYITVMFREDHHFVLGKEERKQVLVKTSSK